MNVIVPEAWRKQPNRLLCLINGGQALRLQNSSITQSSDVSEEFVPPPPALGRTLGHQDTSTPLLKDYQQKLAAYMQAVQNTSRLGAPPSEMEALRIEALRIEASDARKMYKEETYSSLQRLATDKPEPAWKEFALE